jgi:hypothetical protein
MTILDEPLLPTAEAAPVLKVEPETMVAWRHRGEGPAYIKVGQLIFYRPSDLRKYIEARVVQPGRAR